MFLHFLVLAQILRLSSINSVLEFKFLLFTSLLWPYNGYKSMLKKMSWTNFAYPIGITCNVFIVSKTRIVLLTPLEFFEKEYPDMPREELRKYLGRFGVSGKMQMQKMDELSDGQKSRVVFSKLGKDVPHILRKSLGCLDLHCAYTRTQYFIFLKCLMSPRII